MEKKTIERLTEFIEYEYTILFFQLNYMFRQSPECIALLYMINDDNVFIPIDADDMPLETKEEFLKEWTKSISECHVDYIGG